MLPSVAVTATSLALWLVAILAPVSSAASAGAGAAPWESAGPGPHDWSREELTVEVVTGPTDEHTLTIDAELWLPDTASPSAPAPAVLTTNGFGNHKAVNEQLAHAAFFASHGYVVLSYSGLGFGASGGCISLNSLDWDVKAASQMIDWLAARPEVSLDGPGDPKVGMVGGSYGGGLQGLVAATDSRLDAIVPGRTWNTLQYSLVPNNWIGSPDPWDLRFYEQGVFKQGWTSLFFASGASRGQPGNSCDPVNQQMLFPGALPCPGFLPDVCPTYANLAATGDATAEARELVARSSMATMLDQLETPTLLTQGLPDTLFMPTETIPTFLELEGRGVPVAMIWHSGGHGGYLSVPGDGEAYGGAFDDTTASQETFAHSYLPSRTLAWFDRWVRGDESVETGPAFAWFRAHVDADVEAAGGTVASAYGSSHVFPPAEASELALALDPVAGALLPHGSSFTGGDASFLHPAGGLPAAVSEVPNFTGPAADPVVPSTPTEIPGQHLVFETAPLDRALELVGTPVATLRLSHANVVDDVRLFAKLYDVAADGSATLIRRQVAAARVPTAALDQPVDIRLVAQAWQFPAGHRIRLVLASTDSAYHPYALPDVISVASTAASPSVLSLPVIAADADVVPAPPPPTTPVGPGAGPMPATGGGFAGAAALLAIAVALTRLRSDRM